MSELLTSAQMRVIEQAAMESGAVTGLTLMERAGAGVVAAILSEWPDLAEHPGHAVVLCGPGNNGGDGYVIARLLHARGWQVEVLALGDPAKLPPDAATNHARWAALGSVHPLTAEAAGQGPRPGIVVDALFGTGLARAIPEAAVDARDAARNRKGRGAVRTIAVDAPSGLDCDTGQQLLPPPPDLPRDDSDAGLEAWQNWWSHAQKWVCRADLTVSFHAAKLGHYLGQGPGACGKLVVHDIGLGDWDDPETVVMLPPSPHRVRLVGRRQHGSDVPGRIWPGDILPVQRGSRHKYERGHVLVLSGGVGRGGAARLAARAALRTGAGLVTLGCPPAALQENAARLDAIMLRPIRDAEALRALLEDRRIGCVVAGPGLGVGDRTRALVRQCCDVDDDAQTARRVVLDADALTSFAEDPGALFAHVHPLCVLTPHEGEFARLFPDLSEAARRDAGVSKVEAARRAADRAGCTILLKGPDTVIASPGGGASIHAASYGRAAPWLGTAGAGDVLAGLVAGLLAPPEITQSPHPAAEAAAWLHVEAARRFGAGLIAEDLPEQVPGVFASLGL